MRCGPVGLLGPLLRRSGSIRGVERSGVPRCPWRRPVTPGCLVRGFVRALGLARRDRRWGLRWWRLLLRRRVRRHEVDRGTREQRGGCMSGRGFDRSGFVVALLRARPAQLPAQGVVAVAHGTTAPFRRIRRRDFRRSPKYQPRAACGGRCSRSPDRQASAPANSTARRNFFGRAALTSAAGQPPGRHPRAARSLKRGSGRTRTVRRPPPPEP